MWIGVVTLFPEMFRAVTEFGVSGRATARDHLQVMLWSPRDFADDKHRTVDDRPFGGGPGMLMKVEPLRRAMTAARDGRTPWVVCLSPQGARLNHAKVVELSRRPQLLLLAGRYEGFDQRLIDAEVDEEISIGDYVLSGGELAAMALIDAITRLLPGVLGDPESAAGESVVDGLLDYPQYTRPQEVAGVRVPAVLLSGNHDDIRRWRLQQALGRTWERRPDLLEGRRLNEEERRLLDAYIADRQTAIRGCP